MTHEIAEGIHFLEGGAELVQVLERTVAVETSSLHEPPGYKGVNEQRFAGLHNYFLLPADACGGCVQNRPVLRHTVHSALRSRIQHLKALPKQLDGGERNVRVYPLVDSMLQRPVC